MEVITDVAGIQVELELLKRLMWCRLLVGH